MAIASYGGMGAAGAVGAGKQKWYIEQIVRDVNLTMAQRVRAATAFLQAQVKKNINVPVITGIGKRSGTRVVLRRSKPGEFPRRDTGELHKNVKMTTMRVGKNQHMGRVYVPEAVFYAGILERYLDRGFLEKTAIQNRVAIRRMIARPLFGKRGTIPLVETSMSDSAMEYTISATRQ